MTQIEAAPAAVANIKDSFELRIQRGLNKSSPELFMIHRDDWVERS